MAISSPPDTPDNQGLGDAAFETLEDQLRECYGRVVYTHKTHEKDADRHHRHLRRIKLSQIALSAATTAGLIVILFGPSRVAGVLSALASALLLALNLYVKSRDHGEESQTHSDTAVRLWSIRESYQSLLADLRGGDLSAEEIRARRDTLQEKLASVYDSAPRTNPSAYRDAQNALQNEEDMTFSSEEVDRFLPPTLRKN